MVESPRWLISRRRFKDAIKQFRIIARINRKEFHMTEQELAEMYSSMKEEQIYGMMSLFSGWRIARNALIMALNWCVVVVSYFTLLLYCSSMSGNPFLNFLLQTVVEVPSNFIGTYFSKIRLGKSLRTNANEAGAILFSLHKRKIYASSWGDLFHFQAYTSLPLQSVRSPSTFNYDYHSFKSRCPSGNRIGRRFTSCFSYLVAAVFCLPLIILAKRK